MGQFEWMLCNRSNAMCNAWLELNFILLSFLFLLNEKTKKKWNKMRKITNMIQFYMYLTDNSLHYLVSSLISFVLCYASIFYNFSVSFTTFTKITVPLPKIATYVFSSPFSNCSCSSKLFSVFVFAEWKKDFCLDDFLLLVDSRQTVRR